MKRVLPGLLLVCIALSVHWSLRAFPFDDALIHFRVAQHLATAGVPYFNPGEPVYSTSSLFWVFLISLFSVTGLPLIEATALLNALLSTGAALVWTAVAFHGKKSLGTVKQFLVSTVFWGAVVVPSVGLMESALGVLTLGVVAWGYLNKKTWAVLLCAIGLGVRAEFLATLTVLLSLVLFDREASRSRVLTSAGIGLLVVLAVTYASFGKLVPDTIAAKDLVYAVSSADFVQVLIRNLAGPDTVSNYPIAIGVYGFALLLSALLFTFRVKFKAIENRELKVYAFLILPPVLTLGGYLFKGVLLTPWYIPLLSIPLICVALRFLLSLQQIESKVLALLLLLPFVRLAGATCNGAWVSPDWYPEFRTSSRVRQLRQIAEKLNTHYPDAKLLAPEIGGLGFEFRGTILDGVGLVSPSALKHHPVPFPSERPTGLYGVVPVGFAEEVKPDLIVGLDILLGGVVKSDFSSDYERVELPIVYEEDLPLITNLSLWQAKSILVLKHKESSGPKLRALF